MASPDGGGAVPRRRIRDVVSARSVIVSVGLAAAVAGLVIGFNLHKEPINGLNLPSGIGAIYPKAGAPNVQEQTTVFYEVQPGYDGSLTIKDRVIPEDQIEHLQVGRVRIGFTPGEGKEFTKLPGGHVCATATYFRRDDPSAQSNFSWCFDVS